jgi:hypothetical protein
MRLGGNWGGNAFHDGIAAVALPSLHHPLSYDDEAHLTLVYAGDDRNRADITGLTRQVQQLARVGAPFVAEIVGSDLFGDDKDEPVLLLEHPQFKAMRSILEHHDVTNWPYFRPHVAIPTLDGIQRLPKQVAFDRLGVWIGTAQRNNYWLGSGIPTGV